MITKLLDNEWNYINKILLKIHGNNNIDKMRVELLTLLQVLIRFEYASIYLYENEMPTRPVGYNLTQEDLFFYINDLEDIDPFKPLRKLLSDPNHSTIRVHDYSLSEKVEETEYYRAAWKPKGIRWSLFTGFGYNNIMLGSMSLYRAEGDPDFSDRDINIVNILKDHLDIRLWREKMQGAQSPAMEMDIYGKKDEYRLTDREVEVIVLWCKGFTDTEICEHISISNNTLKKHMSNIFGKLGISNRVEFLKIFAKQHEEIGK